MTYASLFLFGSLEYYAYICITLTTTAMFGFTYSTVISIALYWILITTLVAIIILAWYHMTGILMDIYENWSIERTLKGRFVDSVEIAQQNTGGAYDDSNACTVLSRMVAFDMTFVDAQEYLRANFGRALNDGVLTTLYHETLDCLYERGDVVNGKYFTSSISLPKNDKGDNLRVKDYLNKEGTYLLSINGHAICVKDGVLYDSGDMFNTYNTPVRLENKVEDFDILAFIN